MTIGIEAERANLSNPTGVERYAAELIRHLAKIDQDNRYVLYFRTAPQAWFHQLPSNFEIKVMPFPKFWTQLRLSWEMFRHPVDALMILASALPLYHPKNSVVTVHDIAFEIYPKAFTWFNRSYLKFFSRYVTRVARRIITVSQSTKNDLIKFYGADPEKIEVIYLGLSEAYRPQDYSAVQPVLDKHGLSFKKYILFVGTLQPRKNISGLVKAYETLRRNYRIEEKLVLVGGRGWLWQPIMDQIRSSPYAESIILLDYAPAADLPALYGGAAVVTLPALYEGFGLPPLEAMACGTPVVVSNVSSMPEVVGQAGVTVDPHSPDSIAAGLLKVLTDHNLRQTLTTAGLARARQFTWEQCARQTQKLLLSLTRDSAK